MIFVVVNIGLWVISFVFFFFTPYLFGLITDYEIENHHILNAH